MSRLEFAPTKQNEGAVEITIPASVGSLISMLILAVPRDAEGSVPRDPIWPFQPQCSLLRRSGRPCECSASCRVCLLLLCTWDGGDNCSGCPCWTYCERDLRQDTSHHVTSTSSNSEWWSVVIFQVSGDSCQLRAISSNSWEVCVFPSPVPVLRVNGHSLLWESFGRKF